MLLANLVFFSGPLLARKCDCTKLDISPCPKINSEITSKTTVFPQNPGAKIYDKLCCESCPKVFFNKVLSLGGETNQPVQFMIKRPLGQGASKICHLHFDAPLNITLYHKLETGCPAALKFFHHPGSPVLVGLFVSRPPCRPARPGTEGNTLFFLCLGCGLGGE